MTLNFCPGLVQSSGLNTIKKKHLWTTPMPFSIPETCSSCNLFCFINSLLVEWYFYIFYFEINIWHAYKWKKSYYLHWVVWQRTELQKWNSSVKFSVTLQGDEITLSGSALNFFIICCKRYNSPSMTITYQYQLCFQF